MDRKIHWRNERRNFPAVILGGLGIPNMARPKRHLCGLFLYEDWGNKMNHKKYRPYSLVYLSSYPVDSFVYDFLESCARI